MISTSYIGIINRMREFDGGRGTEANPYRIVKIRHLRNTGKYANAFYKLENDIVFTDEFEEDGEYYSDGNFWRPISSLSGTLDGQGYKIENLKSKFTGDNQGGFIQTLTSTGRLYNVYFKNAQINIGGSRRARSGGIIGGMQASSIVEGIFVDGNMYMGTWCGAIAGAAGNSSTYAQIRRCGVNVSLNFGEVYGGLIGNYYGYLINCYARGSLSGSVHGGGLCGTSSLAYAENSYATIWMNGSLRRGIISDYDTTGNGSQSGCYFDTQATNTTNGGRVGATGRTTTQMTYPYDMNNFPVYINWDFDTVWAHDVDGDINGGYPYLRGVTPLPSSEFDYTFDFKVQ